MTREEAINEINKVFTSAYANYIVTALTEGATVSDIQRRWGRAYEAGVKDGLEQEPKWIPVTERLPDKDGLYLVSVKNDHERRYSKTCWYSDKNWFARQDVVAWQPLPEPYKGGQDNVNDN